MESNEFSINYAVLLFAISLSVFISIVKEKNEINENDDKFKNVKFPRLVNMKECFPRSKFLSVI